MKNKVNNIMENITKGTGIIEHYIYRYIVYFLIKHFKLNINPNFITSLSLLYATFCSILIISKKYAIVGVILYFFFNILDLLDGAIARIYNRKSRFGAFFDGLVDLIGEILVLLSIGYYFNKVNYFLFLTNFILFSHYLSIRLKWIYDIKERQTNIFNYINNPILFTLLILRRNDIRKIIIFISILINSWKLVFIYFIFTYLLSFIGSIKILWQKTKKI